MSYKKYNLSLIFIVISLLFCFSILDYFFRKIPNEYQFKFSTIKNNDVNFNTIILGSSQSYFGLDPNYFDKPTLNLANYTQDLKYDKYFLEKSIYFDKSIRSVILPISYFSFF